MKKISSDSYNNPDLILMVINKQNEIIDWITEREKRERELLGEINKGLHVRR